MHGRALLRGRPACGVGRWLALSLLDCDRIGYGRWRFQLTLRDNDCDSELHLLGVCLLAALGLVAIVLSLRACGVGAEVLSERAHICAGANGRAGAATRITMLGCIARVRRGRRRKRTESQLIQIHGTGCEDGRTRFVSSRTKGVEKRGCATPNSTVPDGKKLYGGNFENFRLMTSRTRNLTRGPTGLGRIASAVPSLVDCTGRVFWLR